MSKQFSLALFALVVSGAAAVGTQTPQSPSSQSPAVPPSAAAQMMGFERRCATCHDNPGPESRAPSREALRQFTPERVLAALTTGSMAANARGVSDEEKRTMAELVTGKPFGGAAPRSASAMKNRCADAL